MEPQPLKQSLTDRDHIHNIYDVDTTIKSARTVLGQRSLIHNDEIVNSGLGLLEKDDPYQVKLGIQLIRLCLDNNPDLSAEWIEQHAAPLLDHSHPRVRHSTLWNIRSAVWQVPSQAEKAMRFAKARLNDSDMAVQRVAIWTLGDCVINDRKLFDECLNAIKDYTKLNPRESSTLFCLQEFYLPLQHDFSDNDNYEQGLSGIYDSSRGHVGLRTRASTLLGRGSAPEIEDIQLTKERLSNTLYGDVLVSGIKDADYDSIIDKLLIESLQSNLFELRIRNIWLMRDVFWLDSKNLARKVFEYTKRLISDTNDADFIRTASVLIGDCLLADSDLGDKAIAFINEYIKSTNNDGSQIVMIQSLFPIKDSPNIKPNLKKTLLEGFDGAEKPAVKYTIDCLTN